MGRKIQIINQSSPGKHEIFAVSVESAQICKVIMPVINFAIFAIDSFQTSHVYAYMILYSTGRACAVLVLLCRSAYQGVVKWTCAWGKWF